ncbi:MAG: hypothetical protein RSD08_02470 [Oscillospiraceae bacterium]
MKKTYAITAAFILLSILLLTGCNKNESPISPDEPDAVQENAEDTPQPTGDLKLITRSNGLGSSGYASTEDGIYMACDNDGGSSHLEYIDFSTAKRVYLSNQLDVTFDESNPGWLGQSNGCVPMTDGEYLYIYYSWQTATNTPPKFVQADLTGTNRKELVVPEMTEVRGGSAVASKGGVLYYLADDYNSMQETNAAVALYAADFNKMSVEKVAEISKQSFAFIVGTYKNFLLIQAASPTEGLWQTALYDIEKKEFGEHALVYDMRKTERISSENIIYYAEDTENVLKAFDLLTGEERVLADLSSYYDGIGAGLAFDNEIHDGRLMLSFYNGGGGPFRCLSIDLTTAELKEFGLSYDGPFGMEFARIMAANSEYYYVLGASEMLTVQRMGPDGGTVEETMKDYVGLLIKIEDYWNSNPQYIPIIDTRNP